MTDEAIEAARMRSSEAFHEWLGERDCWVDGDVSAVTIFRAGADWAKAEAIKPYREALERLRDNPFWVCSCTASAVAGDLSEEAGIESTWMEGAVWPDPLTHDPRCTVFIAAEALSEAADQPLGRTQG